LDQGSSEVPILENVKTGFRHKLSVAATTIGRGRNNDVSVSGDNFASGQHAVVYFKNGRFWLEDLGSTNGTLQNTNKIEQPVVLRHGDSVTVGQTVFRVYLPPSLQTGEQSWERLVQAALKEELGGNFPAAELSLQTALETAQTNFGPHHENVANCLCMFAEFLQRRGRKQDAMLRYKLAYSIFLGCQNKTSMRLVTLAMEKLDAS
jgi:pSer/pThr/pTyr-binding forkhead associated (FHA) protein